MRIPLAAEVGLAALAASADATAAVECCVEEGNVLAITTTELADGVALVRESEQIAVSDDRQGLPREGELIGQLNLDDDVDVTASSAGSLRIRGLRGDDRISGQGPAQVELARGEPPPAPLRTFATFEGGMGKDNLIGGTKPDILNGGRGEDLILADRGRRDDVDCGDGFDQVFADRNDRLRDCERVKE